VVKKISTGTMDVGERPMQKAKIQIVLTKSSNYDQVVAAKEASKAQQPLEQPNDLTYDLGNLTAFDISPVNLDSYRENPSKYLQESATQKTQLLFAQIFSLPVERLEKIAGALALLPRPTTKLPREKPVPELRPKTKWEKFADIKGIKNRKRGRLVYDERYQKWLPRWGFKRGKDSRAEWITEHHDVSSGAAIGYPVNRPGPVVDPFTQELQDKKQRIEKQKKHELRNKANALKDSKKSYPGYSVTMDRPPNQKRAAKGEVKKAFETVRTSTASLGRFDRRLRDEKTFNPESGKRRKFKETAVSASTEKESHLKILNHMFKKDEGSINMTKAVNEKISYEQKTKRTATNDKGNSKKRKR